jgi:hypothetical protein
MHSELIPPARRATKRKRNVRFLSKLLLELLAYEARTFGRLCKDSNTASVHIKTVHNVRLVSEVSNAEIEQAATNEAVVWVMADKWRLMHSEDVVVFVQDVQLGAAVSMERCCFGDSAEQATDALLGNTKRLGNVLGRQAVRVFVHFAQVNDSTSEMRNLPCSEARGS